VAPAGRPTEAPRKSAAPAEALVVRAMQVLGPRLPVSETDANDALMRGGVLAAPMPLAELARAAARLRLDPTFHVVDIGGTRVAVAQPDITAARTAYAIASRAVYNWGAATVRGVTEQLGVMVSGVRGLGFVERILTAMTAFEWLDREGGWFWFSGRPNRLMADLVKVLTVAARLSAGRLWTALCRARTGPEQPPPTVLAHLCAALPGVRLLNDVVEARQGPPVAAELSHAESRLVGIFKRSGRPLGGPEIRAFGQAAGLSWKTVRRMLVASPLVEHLSGPRYALIGST
jgi:hypothetical protein